MANGEIGIKYLREQTEQQSLTLDALIRQSRLSVMPIDDDSWALICHMGETKA